MTEENLSVGNLLSPVTYSSFQVHLLMADEEKATDELQKIPLFSGKV